MNSGKTFSFQGMSCVQQKGLLKLWERKRGCDRIPAFSSFPIHDLSRSIDKIMFCDVEHYDAGPKFRIAFHGDQFTRMHHGECVGKYLDEVITPAVRAQGIASYTIDVVQKCRPAFSAAVIQKDIGPEVRYERLALPFSRNGGDFVQRIVCMVTLFSEANGFNIADVYSSELVT